MFDLKSSQWRWMALVTVALLAPGCSNRNIPVDLYTPASPPDASLKVVAYWWSEEQMEELILDDPPPKQTRIELTQWDASDPVATPHPDTAEAVVEPTGLPDNSLITIVPTYRWLVGSIEDKSTAQWTAPLPLSAPQTIQYSPENQPELSVGTLPLKKKLYALFDQGNWAYAVEVNVQIHASDDGAALTSNSQQLELLLAD